MRSSRSLAASVTLLVTQANQHEAWRAEKYIDSELPKLYEGKWFGGWRKEIELAARCGRLPVLIPLGSIDDRYNPTKAARFQALAQKAPLYLHERGYESEVISKREQSSGRRKFYLNVTAKQRPPH